MLARYKWQIKTIAVLEKVFQERERQVARYGHNEDLEDGFGPDAQWIPFSVGLGLDAVRIQKEFRSEYELHEAATGKPTWMHLIREEMSEWLESEPNSPEAIEEAVQTAALLVSWIEKKVH